MTILKLMARQIKITSRDMSRNLAGTRRLRVQDMLQGILNDVAGLDKAVLNTIAPVITQAEREIEKHLKKWLRTEPGVGKFTTQRFRGALLAIRKAKQAVADIEPALAGALKKSGSRSAALASQHVMSEYMTFGAVFEGAVRPLAIDTTAVILRGKSAMVPRFEKSAKRYAKTFPDVIVRELAVSRIMGESMFELSNRLQTKVPMMWTQNRNNAKRLARTEMMSAYNTGHHDSLIQAADQDEELVMRWDSTFDRRRCIICRDLDGQTVSVDASFNAEWEAKNASGKVRVRRMTAERPPAHPNCRCVLTPWRERWAKYARTMNPSEHSNSAALAS